MKPPHLPTRWLPLLAALWVAAPAQAQRFNIDLGDNTIYPLPAATFAAAASQPGMWSGVPITPAVAIAVMDITGAATPVTLTVSGGTPFTSTMNLPGAPIDDLNFLADIHDPGAISTTWTIANLANGDYDIWTYAIAPDVATFLTDVSVAGSADPLQTVGGAWTGVYTQGVTHAKHRVNVAGGPVIVTVVKTPSPPAPTTNFGSINGFQIVKIDSNGASFCAGDGFDPNVTTACPCLNFGAAGHGCGNSVNSAGALLGATGNANPDTIVLMGSGMPGNVACIYLQGDMPDDVVFGDGVRCAGGFLIRLRTKINMGGASQFPNPADTDPSVSTRGMVTPGSGVLRFYQTYYRNSANFCTSATFNVTNGWKILW